MNLIRNLSIDQNRISKRFAHGLYFLTVALLTFFSPYHVCCEQDVKFDFSVFTSFRHITYFDELAEETKQPSPVYSADKSEVLLAGYGKLTVDQVIEYQANSASWQMEDEL